MTARGGTLRSFAGLAAIGLLLALPPSSHAAEDAGTRSVFAHGAGNRALALGGAFVAVADDASAAVWNPGGLGWVARREFQAAHTSYELGFAEEYASIVVPSWRWGATPSASRSRCACSAEARRRRWRRSRRSCPRGSRRAWTALSARLSHFQAACWTR